MSGQQAMDTWVFLRGLTRSSAHWGPFIADFQAALPDAQVIALDLPGNGGLWQHHSPATVAAMVQACRQQLQQRGLAGPVSLLAMSMGGMVAAHWAAHWPQEVSALVLVNTSMRPFSPAWQRMRPGSFLRLLQLAVRAAQGQAREQEILRLTSNHARHDVLSDWVDERVRHPVSAANTFRQLLAAARYRAAAQAPAMPTLVLAGQQDRLVDVRCSLALANNWGVELRLHPTAGHDLTLDDGPWVAAEVRRWRQASRPETI
jgi:pimeloyl-ACP methyl ester carboxylesterase